MIRGRGRPDHEYDVDHRGDLFYIRTNKGAKNFRVVTAPVTDPAEKNWKEFVAHRPAVKVEDINLFADYAVLSEWENGLEQIEIVDLKTKPASSHCFSRTGVLDRLEQQSRIQQLQSCATTINRWSRPVRSLITT